MNNYSFWYDTDLLTRIPPHWVISYLFQVSYSPFLNSQPILRYFLMSIAIFLWFLRAIGAFYGDLSPVLINLRLCPPLKVCFLWATGFLDRLSGLLIRILCNSPECCILVMDTTILVWTDSIRYSNIIYSDFYNSLLMNF